jgi:hypothetical protein
MKIAQSTPKNIDEYIAGFPPEVQEILEKIRRTMQHRGLQAGVRRPRKNRRPR